MINDRTSDIKINQVPIKPRRYLYHVTRPSRRLNILFEGIRPFQKERKYRLAFANNVPPHSTVGNFWPLPIDIYDINYDYGTWTLKAFYSNYDYWRIDTTKANVKWYIDPYMENDCYTYRCGKPENFLCTPSIIPADALDLMEFDLEGYNRFEQVRKGGHPELIYSEFNKMVRYKRDRETNPSILSVLKAA